MPTELGELLRKRRGRKRWSLRDVERETGINNAHLSQIEQGTIERPDPNILWSLSVLYELDFRRLLRLAGHVEKDAGESRKSLVGTALHALGDLTSAEQQEVLQYMSQIKRKRLPGDQQR